MHLNATLILTFLLELKTVTYHFPQRADLCQKSLQNDTETKRQTLTKEPAPLQISQFWPYLALSYTLVCALMKGNPTLHLRKSSSTSSQEIPFSSCRKTEGLIKTDWLETECVTHMETKGTADKTRSVTRSNFSAAAEDGKITNAYTVFSSCSSENKRLPTFAVTTKVLVRNRLLWVK